LISAPSRIAHDVDDWAPAAGACVLSVVTMTTVVVELGTNLNASRFGNLKQSFWAERETTDDRRYFTEL